MNLKVQDITRTGVFAALITIGEVLEDFLPKMPSGGSLELSQVVAIALIIMTLIKTKNKLYTLKIGSLSIILAIIASYTLGLYKWAIAAPMVLILDYIIPQLSVLMVVFATISFKNSIKNTISITMWTILGALIAFASHTYSGVLLWETPLIASLTYNLGYSFITMIAQVLMALTIFKSNIK